MAWERPADDPGLGERLVKEYKIAGAEAADELFDVSPVKLPVPSYQFPVTIGRE